MANFNIAASSVLITGGCGGIGLGVARAFAEQGKQVWLADRNVTGAQSLKEQYPNVQTLEVDLSDTAAIDERLKPLLESDEAPQVLVNGVGYSPKYKSPGERWTTWNMPLSHWREVMNINLDSIFYTTALALPKMMERRYGRVINIISVVSRMSGGGVAPAHYVTAKTALLGLTRVTAQEVGPHGITVNGINPGRIDTPMIHDVPDEVNASIAASLPLRRLGTPDDIAGAALFLSSDMADYLTGMVIEVNGGGYMV